LLGSEQPRLFTPPLRNLTPETSLGFAAIEFAQDVCGIELYPWQRWLLIHMLELSPALTVSTMGDRGRLDPLFRFRKVIVLVARQNGKSTLSQVLSLFFLYVLGTSLILGTAQDLDTAEEVWDGALDIIEDTPELAALADKPIRVNGKKTIRLVTGERYKVKAANRRAGRGLSGDLILLDEIREHQSWDAWGAITKTTMARPAALIAALSNAGDATSVVLRYLRKRAHEVLGDPDGINAKDDPSSLLPSDEELDDLTDLSDDDGPDITAADLEDVDDEALGLFEWSAPPDCDVMDRVGWAWANPSLGHGISERTLAGDAKSDPEWVFRTECLCQWSDGTLEGLFPPGSWEAQSDPESKVAKGERIVACVTVAHDRSRAHVTIAGLREDGRAHVGVVASRAGTEWVKRWLKSDDAPPMESVVVQERGAPESSLIEDLQSAKIPLTMWGGSELSKAHGSFYDAVAAGADGPMRHRTQPILEVAVATATTKPLGEAWVLDLRKSAGDGAPLKGVIGALWGLSTDRKPFVSAYAESDLVII
jgi:hypothetical protein